MAGFVGRSVKVHGERYVITEYRPADIEVIPKFFGRGTFTLVNDKGEKFTAFGKNVAWNSRLTRVSE